MNMHKGSCMLGLKHGDKAILDFAGTKMNISEPAGPVCNPNTTSGIKQAVDSESTETRESEVSEVAKQHLCNRVTQFISEIKLNESHYNDAECFSRHPVLSRSEKPEDAERKENDILSEEFICQNSSRNVNCEKNIPPGKEENLLEYRLDRISIYETGFCVISDPIVPQGELHVSIPYPPPKLKRGRPRGRTKHYERNECGKCIRDGTGFEVHERLHTGESRYQCPACDKRFMYKCRLANHIMIHTGEKPHKCKICRRRFAQYRTLRQHLRTHE